MSDSDPRASGRASLGVVIAGMHRSGTSAVAAALRSAGIFGGEDADLPWSRIDNPEGFLELPEVVHFDDALLASMGWAWDAPPADPPTDLLTDDVRVEEGRAIIDAKFRDASPWFVKDPRISLLLGWWRRILLDRVVVVIPVRPAPEVAWSLAVRDGHPVEVGLALWAAYHRHLAKGLEGLPVVLVDYAALTEDPTTIVPRLLAELERLGVAGTFDIPGAISAIRPVLRRETQPPGSAEAEGLVAACREVERAWVPDPVVGHDRFALRATQPGPWESTVLTAHRRYRLAEHRTTQVRAEADLQLTSLRDELSSARDVAVSLTAVSEQLSIERDQAMATVESVRIEREAEAARAAAARAERDQAMATVESVRIEREAEAARAVAVRAERDQAMATVESVRIEREAEAARAVAVRAERDQAVAREANLREERESILRRADEVGVELVQVRSELARADALADVLGGSVTRRTASPVGRFAVRVEAIAIAHPMVARTFGRAMHGLVRLLTLRWPPGLRPNPLFDADWYRAANPDVAAKRMNPYRHYRRHGVSEGRDPNPWFDTDWYLQQNADVRERRVDPLDHYLDHGWIEGRDPGPAFATRWYLHHNPDVLMAGINPLLHFMRYGLREGRLPVPPVAQGSSTRLPGLDVGSPPSTRTTSRSSAPSARIRRSTPPLSDADRIASMLRDLPGDAHPVIAAENDPGKIPGAEEARWLLRLGQADPPLPAERIGRALVAHLERARWDGADHFLLPATLSWWQDRYPAFKAYLSNFQRVRPGDESGSTWALERRATIDGPGRVVDDLGASLGRDPVVMSWLVPLATVSAALTGASVCEAPPEAIVGLPYIDSSIDVVAIGRTDDPTVREAIRVASWAVFDVSDRSPEVRVIWSRPELVAPSPLSIVVTAPQRIARAPMMMQHLADSLPLDVIPELVMMRTGARTNPGPLLRVAGSTTVLVREAGQGSLARLVSALRAATHDLVLLLDGSAWPLPGAVRAMTTALDGAPDATIAMGTILDCDGNAVDADGDEGSIPIRFALARRVELLAALEGRAADTSEPAAAVAGDPVSVPRSTVAQTDAALALLAGAAADGERIAS